MSHGTILGGAWDMGAQVTAPFLEFVRKMGTTIKGPSTCAWTE